MEGKEGIRKGRELERCRAVMHAGSFFVNRRRRAQNGSAWRRFGGVEQNFIKIYVFISRPKKL